MDVLVQKRVDGQNYVTLEVSWASSFHMDSFYIGSRRGLLIGRTLSVLITMTLGTSMAARQGPLAMAAHQICFQVWMAVSLLSDALAVSGQAVIASSVSKGDYERVKEATYFVLKTGVFTGICLTIILGTWFGSFAELFTSDKEVLQIVRSGALFVSASQPITTLAFVFDGLHYGVSDFSYAAISMMLIGAVSSTFLLYAPSVFGLQGVWAVEISVERPRPMQGQDLIVGFVENFEG
ncbi:Protein DETOXIFICATION 45, chloroplastic [Asimina triloba]